MKIKKLLLEKANDLASLEKQYVEDGGVPPQELLESWDVFESVSVNDVIPRPSIIVRNDVDDSNEINESVKIITEAYLQKKDRDYVSFLEVSEGKVKQNFIIQSLGFDDAKKVCNALDKDSFFFLRENFAYKIAKIGDRWAPILQTKSAELFQESVDDERYYRILGKKYKTLF